MYFIFNRIIILDVWKYFIYNKTMWVGLKIIPILLLANMFLGIYYNLTIWYKLSNKTMSGVWITLFGCIITLVIIIFLYQCLVIWRVRGQLFLLWWHDDFVLLLGKRFIQFHI